MLHGVKVVDPYRWLEDGNRRGSRNGSTAEHLHAVVLDKLPGRDEIRERLDALLEIGSLGTPTPRQGPLLLHQARRQAEPAGPLRPRGRATARTASWSTPTQLAKDGTVALDWWFPSRDGKLLAYGLSKDGSEQSTLHVRDVATGKDLPDVIERTRACSVAWLPDGKGFYYTRYPAAAACPRARRTTTATSSSTRSAPTRPRTTEGLRRGPADRRTGPTSSCRPTAAGWSSPCSQGWAKSEILLQGHCRPKDATFVPLVEKVDAHLRRDRAQRPLLRPHQRRGAALPAVRVDPLKPADAATGRRSSPKARTCSRASRPSATRWSPTTCTRRPSRLQLARPRRQARSSEVELPTLGTVAGLGGEWDGDELFFGFQSFTVPPSDLSRRSEDAASTELWEQVQGRHRLRRLTRSSR